MQLISKFNKEFQLLLCAIDVYSKYAWIVPLKDKKGITITNAFQKILDNPDWKPSKIWVNIHHNTFIMRQNDVKPSLYFEFGIKNNDKDPKF